MSFLTFHGLPFMVTMSLFGNPLLVTEHHVYNVPRYSQLLVLSLRSIRNWLDHPVVFLVFHFYRVYMA